MRPGCEPQKRTTYAAYVVQNGYRRFFKQFEAAEAFAASAGLEAFNSVDPWDERQAAATAPVI